MFFCRMSQRKFTFIKPTIGANRANGRTIHNSNGAKPVGNGTIRRELAILSAAIKYWHEAHGPLTAVPVVTLPKVAHGRDKILEQDERIRLIAGALGFYQHAYCDVSSCKEHVRCVRIRQHINQHMARFILLASATGSRKGVVLSMTLSISVPAGWVDIDRRMLRGRALDKVETKRRKPPSGLGNRIMALLPPVETHRRRTESQTHRRRAGIWRRRG